MKLITPITKSIIALTCTLCMYSDSAPVRVTGSENITGHIINIPEDHYLNIIYILNTNGDSYNRNISQLSATMPLNPSSTYYISGDKMQNLKGPAVLTIGSSLTHVLEYEIVSNDLLSSSEIKYTSSLSSDGNRLAIAQQDGTNSFTRVYEFDGSSWNQLGADVQ